MRVSTGGAQPTGKGCHIQLRAICFVEKLVALNCERRQSVYMRTMRTMNCTLMTIGSTLVAATAEAAKKVAAASAVDATPKPFMFACGMPRYQRSVVETRSTEACDYL